MFLHLSVSHSVQRGCLPKCMLGYTHPWADTPPPGQTLSPWVEPPANTPPPGQTPPAKANGYCCGWYASYWNAFLLLKPLSNIVRFLSRNCLFERINRLQWCELTRRCSHLPLKLASPFTYAVHQWSESCKCAMKHNKRPVFNYFHFRETFPQEIGRTLSGEFV